MSKISNKIFHPWTVFNEDNQKITALKKSQKVRVAAFTALGALTLVLAPLAMPLLFFGTSTYFRNKRIKRIKDISEASNKIRCKDKLIEDITTLKKNIKSDYLRAVAQGNAPSTSSESKYFKIVGTKISLKGFSEDEEGLNILLAKENEDDEEVMANVGEVDVEEFLHFVVSELNKFEWGKIWKVTPSSDSEGELVEASDCVSFSVNRKEQCIEMTLNKP